jgi:lactate dehydrogenase-like 2-hydroxyacid dehydrogenase
VAKPTVLISRRWPAAVESVLMDAFDVTLNATDQPLSAAEMRAALQSFDAFCPTVTDRIGADVLGVSGRRARILGNFGVGFNHIDLAAARRLGIVVTNTPDVLTECTADLVLTLLLMVARRAGEGERLVRSGAWDGWSPTQMLGSRVAGKTLAIIGPGRIGLAVAHRARHGFAMRILLHGRRRPAEAVLADLDATFEPSLDALLPAADFVSLHCPSTPATNRLLNAERLKLLKPTAFVVNTARGDVIDETALIDALQRGAIAGAGLDVYEHEPAVPEALRSLPNVVLLPHLGSATLETRAAMGLRVVDNLLAFFAGMEPPDRVA